MRQPCKVCGLGERYSTTAYCYPCHKIYTRDRYRRYRNHQPGDRCEACGATDDLVLDHDHRSKAVRGTLCRPCNFILGHADDDPARLRALATYLEAAQPEPPPSRLFYPVYVHM